MARISVTKSFKLNDIVLFGAGASLAIWPGIPQRLRFATVGIYDVTDEIASHWYVANFASVVDPSTGATASYSVVSF